MKIKISSALIVVLCLAWPIQTMILNTDQLKALKLARPFLDSSSLTKTVKNKAKTFHRNLPRNLSLVEATDRPIENAQDAIIGEALDVSDLY